MLTLVLSACSDNTAPGASFDPGAVVADVQATKVPFQTPVYKSFAGVSEKIDAALGVNVAGAGASMLAGGTPGASRSLVDRAAAQTVSLVRSPRSAGGAQLSIADIPPELLGTTFVWSAESTSYVPSDLPGAPSNGVTFLLYSISEADYLPAQPLQVIGSLTMAATQTETGGSIDVRVADATDATLLHYVLSRNGDQQGLGTVMLKGHITDLTTRADFELYNTVSADSGGKVLMSADVKVPGRPTQYVSITDKVGLFTEDASDDFAKMILQYTGQVGKVDMVGEFYDGDYGIIEISYNDEQIARMKGHLSTRDWVAVDLDDNPLPEQTEQAFMLLNSMQYDMLQMFLDLAQPLDQFIGWYYLVL